MHFKINGNHFISLTLERRTIHFWFITNENVKTPQYFYDNTCLMNGGSDSEGEIDACNKLAMHGHKPGCVPDELLNKSRAVP